MKSLSNSFMLLFATSLFVNPKQFKDWDQSEWDATDIEEWKRANVNGNTTDVIPIDDSDIHYYIPAQQTYLESRIKLLQHWHSVTPTNIHPFNSNDYPLNKDFTNPKLYFHGRLSNPYSKHSMKRGVGFGGGYRNTTPYWTDDGEGDYNNLWTVALTELNTNPPSPMGDIYWAIRYSHQHTYQRFGYVVVFQLKNANCSVREPTHFGDRLYRGPRDLETEARIIPRKGHVTSEWGYYTDRSIGPDAYVFTPYAQIQDCELDILRVYLLDYTMVLDIKENLPRPWPYIKRWNIACSIKPSVRNVVSDQTSANVTNAIMAKTVQREHRCIIS